MKEKMVIVGAGIAGLATGFYAQLNGFDVVILEAQREPGGLCAAWTRKGYTFDMSMHLLTNSRRGPFRKMWEELGVVDNHEFHYHDSMYTIEKDDRRLVLSTDRQRLLSDLLSISPSDRALSQEFVDLFCGPDSMGAASLKPAELYGPLDYLHMLIGTLPLIRIYRRYGKTTLQAFAERFQEPFLREAIRMTVDSPGWHMPRFPLAALSGFAQSSVTDAGTPIGGSNEVVRGIAGRFERYGGTISYKSEVAEIMVEDDRATGVRLANGETVTADTIVWAADGHHLIFDLLEGRYTDATVRKMYSEWTPVAPLVQVMIGVARDMSKEPARIAIALKEPIQVGGTEQRWLSVISHAFDPTMAPEGKTALEVWFSNDYDYWKRLADDRSTYTAEKKRIAREVVAALDKRWTGFAGQVELLEVATPATYVRYTGNWQGSPDGWYVTVDNVSTRSMLRSLPGLSGLYAVGQWTAPYTGTVMAALSGRQLIEILCRRQHRGFRTVAEPAAVG